MKRATIIIMVNFFVLGVLPMGAFANSIYVDFDGTGSGTLYSAPKLSSPIISCASGCGDDRSLNLPTSDIIQEDNRRMLEYQEWRLDEQKEEQKARQKREEEERKARQRYIARRERFLDMDSEDQKYYEMIRERNKIKTKIIKLVPAFDNLKDQELQKQLSLRERLALSINQIKVPPPRPPLEACLPSSGKRSPNYYKSVLFLGTGNAPEDAKEALKKCTPNPFTGEPYEKIFAFGQSEFTKDLVRAVSDHVLAEQALLSDQSMSHIGELRGATIEEIVAHSNGATVAEVLIRTVIKRVKVFRILGGDRSLMALESLQTLPVEKVYVYVNQGDIVPLLPQGWQIRELMEKVGGPLKKFEQAKSLTYQVLGLRHPDPPGQSKVTVQLFSVPDTWTSIDKHAYANYHRLINGRRLQGCLDLTQLTDPKCKF